MTLDDAKIFEPTLQIIAGKGKVINDLRKAASTADAVYLAGDPDREGEAISAHLAMVLSKPSRYAEAESSEKPNGKELAAEEEASKRKRLPKNGKKQVKAESERRRRNHHPADGSQENLSRHFQRNYAEGDSRGFRASAPGGRQISWTRSRRAACSIASWVTRFRRCFGTKCAADYPPGACRPSRCA